MSQEAFPLTWPVGRPRTKSRQRSKFKVASFERARLRLFRELELLGARKIILSTNIPIRNDGMPYAKYSRIQDPGVAVYFQRNGRPTCIACDRYDRVEDNLHAIELTVDAFRGIERWGSSDMMDRAFTGFAALPAPEQDAPWYEVLQLRPGATLEEAREGRDRLLKRYHPDGGSEPSHDLMVNINRAWQQAQGALQ
jgi:hypothetical protein